MFDVDCEIYAKNWGVYDGKIPSSTLKLFSKNKEFDDTYTIAMESADRIVIKAAGASVMNACSGMFELNGPVMITFLKDPETPANYKAGINRFVNKEALRKHFEEQFRKNVIVTLWRKTWKKRGERLEEDKKEIKINPYKRFDRLKLHLYGIVDRVYGRQPLSLEDSLEELGYKEFLEKYPEKLISTVLNFDGKLYFNSIEDYKQLLKTPGLEKKWRLSGGFEGIDTSKIVGYDLTWYIPREEKFKVMCL